MKVTKKSNINISKMAKQIEQTNAKVGFFDTAVYEDGTSVASVAIQNEFGVPQKRIPPRPFMRPAKDNNSAKWKKTFLAGMKQGDAKHAFNLVGMAAQGDIKEAIKEVTRPALATSTVEARLKGKKQGKAVALTIAKPLVDSGYMLTSVEYEVN